MRSYLKFKKELRYEEYLDYNPDFRIRRNITKIEAGRYRMKNKKKIPATVIQTENCKKRGTLRGTTLEAPKALPPRGGLGGFAPPGIFCISQAKWCILAHFK